jgi:hypothetical protein
MTTETTSKLDAIVGKTFNYKGKNITIDKYKLLSGTNIVVFMPGPINFLNSEIDGFLESLFDPIEKAITVGQVLVPKKEFLLFEPTAENKTIKETLMATLEKVKNDPLYIPQAKAVCDVVSSLIDVQKNEIQMLAIFNKYK